VHRRTQEVAVSIQSAGSGKSPHDEVLTLAADRARAYLAAMDRRRVFPTSPAIAALKEFREPFPEAPLPPEQVLAMLDRIASPATVTTAAGRYFGFVMGSAVPAATAANWLAGAWNQNTALRVMSPAAVELEDVVLSWVCEVLDLPPSCEGALVTCATSANFSALVAARSAILARAGWNAEDDGLFGAPPIEVVVGQEAHASVLKALALAGFGRKRVTVVEADSQGRMRADKLPRFSEQTIVCIQAGNVNTGAFDPAKEICKQASDQGAWVHVDGAFGIWAGVSPQYRHLTEGLEDAHSWATDAHKWPNAGYDCGIVLVRDGMALRRAMTLTAAYLQAGTRREPMNQGPDASRRARAVELWATLKSLGRAGLRDLIERTCQHARSFADGLRVAGYQILNDVVINQVLVSFGNAERTRKVIGRIQEDGTCWCGETVWQGKTAMRISVSSWRTTAHDVQQSLEAILRVARGC
jgi:glutamate/tyrosine decarboxylase-like PLP-dependent enzyme